MAKKKFSAKQLAAQRKFAAIMKSGGFKKKKKSKSKNKKTKSNVKPSKTRRNRGGSSSDIPQMAKDLLLMIKDPNIKEIIIKK